MAIAFDTATGNDGTGSPNTYSHTCTGINLILFVGIRANATATSVTYNGVSMTKVTEQANAGEFNSLWYLINPATGANNVVATATGATGCQCVSASYTGARLVGIPDSFNSGTTTSAQPITVSTTTVADNCWVVGVGQDNSGAGVVSAGASTTERHHQNNSLNFVDTNGVVTPAGSRSLSVADTAAANMSLVIASFAPQVQTAGFFNFL